MTTFVAGGVTFNLDRSLSPAYATRVQTAIIALANSEVGRICLRSIRPVNGQRAISIMYNGRQGKSEALNIDYPGFGRQIRLGTGAFYSDWQTFDTV
jgi:hypothetical protein